MYPYPSAPNNIDSSISEPSVLYKKEVVKSVLAILFFIITYFILISAAAILSYYCVKLGLYILTHAGHLIGLIAGAGVILIGLLIFYFVIKFIFNSYKTDKSSLIEIKENDQPQLFNFIRNITNETQAVFPKKIFLSNEVNASVFYDSSFWSMFFPVKKNLLIGLGLVNSVNISEFKAILAHEFGHFSQKSMKVGSYVYNANRIIHNLLYDNGGFYKTLNTIAQVHYILYICMYGVSGIVRLIQKTLNEVYVFINKQNMKLSREMEFHADSVAATVAGSEPLIRSLYRLELAETSFRNTLSMCSELIKEQKLEKNIYSSHSKIMQDFANINNITIRHNLPDVHRNSFQNFNTNRINIHNQWASHPSTEDREDALLKLNVPSDEVALSAWLIFVNKEQLQEKMTQKIYENSTRTTEDIIELNSAQNKYFEFKNHYELPSYLKGYWDLKLIPKINIEEIGTTKQAEAILYHSEDLNLSKQLTGLEKDIATLDAIVKKEINTNSFDFNGIKYSRKEAVRLYEQFKLEKEILENTINDTNVKYIVQHYHAAVKDGYEEIFKSCMNEIYFLQEKNNIINTYHEEIFNEFLPIFQGVEMNIEDARNMVRLVQKKESLVKEIVDLILKEFSDWNQLKGKPQQELIKFIESNRIYLNDKTFEDVYIRELLEDLDSINQLVNELSFIKKKALFLLNE